MKRSISCALLAMVLLLTAGLATADTACTDWSSTSRLLAELPDVTGDVCALDGDRIYVADSRFTVVGIDALGNCTALGSLDLSGSGSVDIVVNGDRVYVVTWNDYIVSEIDISDPAAPALTRTYGGTSTLLDLAVLGGTVIAVDNQSQLHLLDTSGGGAITATIVTLPDSPTFDLIETIGTTLIAGGCDSVGSYDVSDPTAPVALSSHSFGNGTGYLTLTGDAVYFQTGYSTMQGPVILQYRCQISSDGSLASPEYLADLPVTPTCGDGTRLACSDGEIAILDPADFSELCSLDGQGYMALEGDYLCAADSYHGLKLWFVPSTPAVLPEVVFDAPGTGSYQGGYWVMSWGQFESYGTGGGNGYSAEFSIFDISDPLVPVLAHERSMSTSCSEIDCSPGSCFCTVTGSRWALYGTSTDWGTSWNAVDIIGDASLGYGSGDIVHTTDSIVWSMDAFYSALRKYELSVTGGLQLLYSFDGMSWTTLRNIHWVDENTGLLTSTTATLYDFSDSAGITTSTAWPSGVPAGVTWVGHRDRTVYVSDGSTLYAIDCSDLAAPVLVDQMAIGTMAVSYPGADVLPLYGDTETRLVFLDPAGGFRACSGPIPGEFEAAQLIGDHVYCHDGASTLLYDLSDMAAPAFVGTGSGGTGGMAKVNGYLIDNTGVYLPHCGAGSVPTVLQAFTAVRDGARAHLDASVYGEFETGEIVLWRETDGGEPVEMTRQVLDAGGRFAWTDPAAPSTAATYRLQVDGAWLGDAAIPAADLPQACRLLPNVPNPFNPKTTLRYEMSQPGHAELSIYDARGRRVVKLLDEFVPAGAGVVEWNGRDAKGRSMPSGNYLAAFKTDESTTHRKLMLAR